MYWIVVAFPEEFLIYELRAIVSIITHDVFSPNMAILIVCVLIRTSGRGHHLRRRIKAIVDSLNLESSFDLSDEEESDRESRSTIHTQKKKDSSVT